MMPNQTAPLVVFDLDGTLADTAPDLIGTLNVLLAREGLPAMPTQDAGALIGAGARALISRGFAAAGHELVPERLDALFEDFLVHYGENICVGTRLYPGVVAAMDALAADGFRLAVCTNKIERHSVVLLERLEIAERFVAICGRDTFPWFKPDPRHLTLTIEAAGGDPARTVMIGDSLTDIATAKAAKVPVVAVPFGYSDRPVAEYEPDILIEHFDELHGAIARMMRAAA